MTIPSDVAAYLAGAMDSDGSIGIRRSTYAQRVRRDARAPVYSERIGLKQVTPHIPLLLKECFGGSLMVQSPSAARGRPLHYWEATNRVASDALRVLLPHLRIKVEQAETVLALRESKDRPRLETHSLRAAVPSTTGTGVHLIGRREVSAETLAERERLYLRIKELNSVGV